jgi:hypothetical protein
MGATEVVGLDHVQLAMPAEGEVEFIQDSDGFSQVGGMRR